MIQIMKNRNLILSVVLWVIASAVFAVKLPSSPFQATGMSYDAASENITVSSGAKYTQVYLTSNITEFADACYGTDVDEEECIDCCVEYEKQCKGDTDCYQKVDICKTTCREGPSLPLGTPLMLLPFIAAYAVLRRREQA